MAWIVVIVSIAACNFRHEKETSTSPFAGESWYGWLKRAVIEPKCMDCHMGAGAAMGMDLTSRMTMVDSGAIVPGVPEESPFFTSIESGKMPKNAARLSDSEVLRIYQWIKNGAPGDPPEVSPTPSPTPSTTPEPLPTFSWLNENVFVSRCFKCHQPPKPQGDVDFSSYQRLLDSEGITKKAVVPDDPLESGIYDQVIRKKMPPGPDKLSPEEEQLIHDWIQNGATQ